MILTSKKPPMEDVTGASSDSGRISTQSTQLSSEAGQMRPRPIPIQVPPEWRNQAAVSTISFASPSPKHAPATPMATQSSASVSTSAVTAGEASKVAVTTMKNDTEEKQTTGGEMKPDETPPAAASQQAQEPAKKPAPKEKKKSASAGDEDGKDKKAPRPQAGSKKRETSTKTRPKKFPKPTPRPHIALTSVPKPMSEPDRQWCRHLLKCVGVAEVSQILRPCRRKSTVIMINETSHGSSNDTEKAEGQVLRQTG